MIIVAETSLPVSTCDRFKENETLLARCLCLSVRLPVNTFGHQCHSHWLADFRETGFE